MSTAGVLASNGILVGKLMAGQLVVIKARRLELNDYFGGKLPRAQKLVRNKRKSCVSCQNYSPRGTKHKISIAQCESKIMAFTNLQ